jgi:hypothetical protein
VIAGGVVSAMGQPPDKMPVPPADRLAFRLMRHGSPIGTHVLTFRGGERDLDVTIAVEAAIRLGPIPLYRYQHNASEIWRDGRLQAVTGKTDKNGTLQEMHLERTAKGLSVQGTGTPLYLAPERVLPTTYWNKNILFVPLIGTQDGGLLHPRVTDRGNETVRNVDGSEVRVRTWELSGDLNITVLYDDADHLAGMRVTIADGSLVSYERM